MTGPRPELVVIGDVVTDVVVRLAGPLRRATDTEAAISVHPGGSGANAAAWAAAAGATVALVARVGADEAEWHRRELERLGVVPLLAVDAAQATSRIVVLVEPDGERSMLTDRAASAALGPEDLDLEAIRSARMLHVSGYALFVDTPRAAVHRAAEVAAAAGVERSIDPSSAGFLHDLGVDRFLEWTRGWELVLPNLDEARALTGEHDAERCAVALSEHYGTAVVTLGAEGALAARGGAVVARSAAVATSVVDTTGAGDAFTAGFLAAHCRGADLDAALSAGVALAARAVAHPGARPTS